MRHVMTLIVRGILILLVMNGSASAQTAATAQINGTVKDPAGLALPGVTITATKVDTGLQRTTVTDDIGSYTLQNLPVGSYRVEATLQGFRTFVQMGIVLQVGDNSTLPITLQLGQLEETVTVAGTAALVETRNPGIGHVVTNQQVLELPLNGRQLTELVFQAGLATGGKGTTDAPGANMLNSGSRSYPNTSIVVAGGLSNGMTYVLDGGTHNEAYNNYSLPLPFPDAMQEFRVETSALPAQYGHHSAAAVTAITKSGTNTLHGSAFEFLRDHRLNATSAFAAIGANGKRKSDGLRRDQFGGTIGGPIIEGKLFYFGGYQATRVDVTPSTAFGFVPTPAMLAGDFAAVASPACNAGRQIALRVPFTNNTISPSQFSAAALQLTSRLPTPVNDCGQTFYSRRTPSTEHLPIVRIDYQLANSHSLFGRYQLTQYNAKSDFDPNNVLAYSQGIIDDTVHAFVAGDQLLFGSNAVNAFRVTRLSSDISKKYVPFFDAADLGARGFAALVPDISSYNVNGAFEIAGANGRPSDIGTATFQLANDLSMVRGPHQFGVGVNYIRSTLDAISSGFAIGLFTFNGQTTGLGLGDFLVGRFSQLTQGNAYTPTGTQHYVGTYVQDAWKVSDHLTLNLGLRWEPYLPFSDTVHKSLNHFSMDAFRAGVRSTVYTNAPPGVSFQGDPGFPGNAFAEKYWGNFAPRVAGVWDPRGDGRMTVRAAWGKFNDLPHLWNYFWFARNTPFGSVININNGTFDEPWRDTPGGNPFPVIPQRDMTFPLYGSFATFPFDYKPPYSNQWNVSVQRQLGASWMASANYLTSQGRRLLVGDDINAAVYSPGATPATTNRRRVTSLLNPAEGQYYGQVQSLRPGATSEYRGLLLSIQNRGAKGLSLNANWTISKCVSDVVYYESNFLTKPGDIAFDRGSCGATDQRHVVNVSAVYQIPAASQNGVLGALSHDWQVSAIVAARSGRHFNVTTGVDNALNGQPNQRPNLVNDDVYRKTGRQWLNPAAFQAPAAGTFGNLENNSLIGPRRFNIDMGLVRSFPIGGERKLQFRAEAFNVLNRVQRDDPVSAMNNPNFGRILSAADPRIVQLALKYAF